MSFDAATRAARIARCESAPNTSIFAALGAARKRSKLSSAKQTGSNQLGALEHLTKLAVAALVIEWADNADPLSVDNLTLQDSGHDVQPQDLKLALLFVSKEWCALTLECFGPEMERWSSGRGKFHSPSPLATHGRFANMAAQYAAYYVVHEDAE